VLEGLEGGNEPVEAEGDDTRSHQHGASLFSHPLPHEPGATDLGDGGDYEQSNRFQDRHDVDCRATNEGCMTQFARGFLRCLSSRERFSCRRPSPNRLAFPT